MHPLTLIHIKVRAIFIGLISATLSGLVLLLRGKILIRPIDVFMKVSDIELVPDLNMMKRVLVALPRTRQKCLVLIYSRSNLRNSK